MSLRLRDLIKNVRNAKTQAEERGIISKECANIRTEIKTGVTKNSARNVSKLMYIHMMGYPTDFGQMETITLLTSKRYPEKRIGYLALMILLDETKEVLTLVENTLKKDLEDPNQFVQSLALSAIANIGSTELCRGLSSDVEKLLFGSAYIKKKAALCACRVIIKAPELIENYIEKFESLLKEQKNNSVLLTVVSMMIEVSKTNLNDIIKFVPLLLRILKGLISTSYSENEIGGVADPFLQVKILRLLRILGAGNQKASEMMNDLLVEIATHTESSRNAGHAILYEVVQTILNIESDTVLKNLAVTILGKFLVNKDNNIRYVALNTFKKVAEVDPNSVLKHLKTILECIKDYDVSIKKRALHLTSEIASVDNSDLICDELILQLDKVEVEFKEELTHTLCIIIEEHSKDINYKMNAMISVLQKSAYVRDDAVTGFINQISQVSQEFQSYVVNSLFKTLQVKYLDPLAQITVWCVGEYGDYLQVSHSDVFEMLTNIIEKQPLSSIYTKELAMTALLKIVVRFRGEFLKSVEEVFTKHKASPILELQQRSNLYLHLLENLNEKDRSDILARLPPIEKAIKIKQTETKLVVPLVTPIKQQEVKSNTSLLLDLFTSGENLPRQTEKVSQTNLLDIFSVVETSKMIRVFEKDGVIVEFDIQSPLPNVYQFTAQYSNGNNFELENFEFLVAVPKYLTLKIKKATGEKVPPKSRNQVNQEMQITNTTPEKPVMMKIKLKYTANGQTMEENSVVKDFPRF